jgi:hypothetical protein
MTGMPKLWLTAVCWAAPYGVDLAGRSPSTLGLRCYHVRSVLGVSARDAIEARHDNYGRVPMFPRLEVLIVIEVAFPEE